ncbi:Syntaxin-binding protein 5 [Liparis tanakae]|uniref:Syntaxin-binding protein 5 n=1 Tax=Liparis tanakae TaxID=230148 RepID=A0A4Z2HL64_9TELE|nr:Syntaxin-binding protein 5 [Liparis tanakae]
MLAAGVDIFELMVKSSVAESPPASAAIHIRSQALGERREEGREERREERGEEELRQTGPQPESSESRAVLSCVEPPVPLTSEATIRQFSDRKTVVETAFKKVPITFCHLPFQSKWLYIGTERGNIHLVNVESFMLSGYVIMWNKAIEL